MDHKFKPAVFKFVCLHHAARKDHLRLGQRFCNLYVKEPWPALYYECDDGKAFVLIADWLERYQYCDDLPPQLNRIELPH